MRLERIVEQEKESYEAIQLDLIVANREFRDFKHNQYEVMKGKYEQALDEAKIANNKFEQVGILHKKEL